LRNAFQFHFGLFNAGEHASRQVQQLVSGRCQFQWLGRAQKQRRFIVMFQYLDLVRKCRLGKVKALCSAHQAAGFLNGDKTAQMSQLKNHNESNS